jgi:hypothetical protein
VQVHSADDVRDALAALPALDRSATRA